MSQARQRLLGAGLFGNFANKGTEWHPIGMAENVNAYDFLIEAEGIAVPYGVYDIRENIGWVNVGITKDTAGFAVQSIRNWWHKMGVYYHNTADSLLITADGGGSNSSKGKLWKYELHKFSNETGLTIDVAQYLFERRYEFLSLTGNCDDDES